MKGDNLVPQLISSGGFEHDLIRCLICLWAQHNNYEVHSEPPGYGEYKPDLVLRQKKANKTQAYVAFVEIQKIISQDWLETKYRQYHPKLLIIIDLKRYPVTELTPDALYERVSEQMSMETAVYLPKKVKRPQTPKSEAPGNYYTTTEDGRRVKAKNLWKHGGRTECQDG